MDIETTKTINQKKENKIKCFFFIFQQMRYNKWRIKSNQYPNEILTRFHTFNNMNI